MINALRFITAAAVVFSILAITSEAMAEHDGGKTPTWFVIVDWDANGEPFIDDEWEPQPLDTLAECRLMGQFAEMVIAGTDPDRRYVSACIHPQGADTLDDIIDMIIEDFAPYFKPVGRAA